MKPNVRRTLAAAPILAVAAVACGQEGAPKDGAAPAAPGAPAAPAAPAAPKPADDEKWETTASGLSYRILDAGKDGGVSPKDGDFVVCDYRGWLENGKVFDESARHGGPQRFPVGGLIEGWNEALRMMKPGAKWKLRIPPAIGYGAQGSGPDIPGNSTLYFELTLHEVVAMPVFVRPVPEKQTTLPSGLKYEVVKEGTGDVPGEKDAMELRFAIFNPNGKLLDCSERGRPIRARMSDMALPFLREAPKLLHVGARYRFEVPPALAFGAQARGPDLPANSITYWELELVSLAKPMKAPDFRPVDGAQFKPTASGLQIEVVKEGSGDSPKMGQTVRVHYIGWLTDGTEFDSSYGRGEPAEFRLGEVIEGWNEGLQTMKPGGVCRFVIPAKLAYGDRAVGDKIKPGSTLVFQVELLEVKK